MFKEGAEKKIKNFSDFAGFYISLSCLEKFFMRMLGEFGQKYYSAILTMCSHTYTHTHTHTHTNTQNTYTHIRTYSSYWGCLI